MATRTHSGVWLSKGVYQVTWSGLLNGDVGDDVNLSQFPDKSVQIKGTPGAGGTLVIEGSNDGGTTRAQLNDSRGETNALSFTAVDIRTVLENTQVIRPNVTGGDGTTNLAVVIVATKRR
jgi:hypothetical protein